MKKGKVVLLLLLIVFGISSVSAQAATEVYPTNWWTGMKMNQIQLLIRSTDEELASKKVSISHPGITILKTHQFENDRYVAVDISIAPTAKPGVVTIELKGKGKTQKIKWRLDQKREGNGTAYAQGVTSSDFIDLLITDRFSNGDPSNDRVAGMRDQSLNRDSIYYRHGGDFQGIINHIDYFKSLGVSALWLLPVLENDRPDRTEHGYAITNHYKIDPRLGGAAKYKELSDALHKNGMKLIMDAVYNHTGLQHFLELDPPAKDWMHRWPSFTQTTYREQTLFDPYAAPSDKKRMSDGWFDNGMPDINQNNPFMANFIIQNMIWYIQEFGIDGIRIDTYTYSDLEFANRCNKAIMDEYPNITMFGETRVFGTANQAYFNANNLNLPYKSNLQSSVDFQCLYYGIIPALTEPISWTNGVNKLYNTASNDFLNKNPMQNVLLLDNHDEPRFFSVVGEDVEKQKIGYQWLLTYRGIPQLYYGSEVLMKGFTNPFDGLVRKDFPGGWKGDSKNAFTGKGLTKDEREVQDLVKKLGNFRKNSSAIKTGKMMHYVPVNGVYVYFRYDDDQTIMCVMNTDSKAHELDFKKYAERTSTFSEATNIISNDKLKVSEKAIIPAMQMWVLELKK
ncbi:alpha-amylase family glycosyl hydrolase [Pontibacter fetidus]|uniref:Alpha-amylase n=1 Tax=Pontibacter fetidus TaxID=2700082 RepID=A0A6B2GXP9_9BACT|nr:alpha-amylase family glycosyl hydrolase [Pontibacter fetidus]NDK55729.1 alpha-amylase [Pontibacter fetidus]